MCIIISKNQSNAHISQETSQRMPEFSWPLDNMSPVTLDKIITFWLLTLSLPTSDQDRISPYNINTISSRQVMRIEKNINDGIIS